MFFLYNKGKKNKIKQKKIHKKTEKKERVFCFLFFFDCHK